ncbi:hypothetical protein C1X64_18205 [Pseudomonas sp. GW456-E7]|nr:hypothetical protein C1X64_18205 [Pseudomonas sp. GW456-E7]
MTRCSAATTIPSSDTQLRGSLLPLDCVAGPLGLQSNGAASHPNGSKLPRHIADYSRNNPLGWHTGRPFGPGA